MLHEAILKLIVKLQIFLQEKDGASGIEYALVAAMVALALSFFITPISGKINGIFTAIQGAITT
ncbi:Flp family type IVb pilin [Pseudomonas gingeri]|uniref:Flp family type IVb pilin n=1 Tax=Pseudomonas gingeri TaxID=117681 RepID=A0A7Y7XHB5_9PSED|nr:Flp family type IVb pilin [Pseudomonas gingeri]NWA25259.1 Flp family type IVb pilin [Pseudomonas gingeri]NWB99908.1 Flp family type IVb pilin [Pseudomonas gingeri]NWD73578.1 Flp family type IVb pilin [Pseudomonas gingeri]